MPTTCFTGSTNQIELSKSQFAGLRLLLPPLPEQRKIAAILSSVDEATETTQAIIDQLQVVKQAMPLEHYPGLGLGVSKPIILPGHAAETRAR
jgi:hypothetical protein